MTKSNHKYNNWEIPYDELAYFIDPINMTIKIPYYEIHNLLSNYRNTYDYLNVVYSKLLDNIPTLKHLLNNKNSYPISCISYTSHITGYDFRIHPIDVINNIFTYLGLDYNIPFINLDNPEGLAYFKDYVRAYLKDIKRTSNDTVTQSIMDEINTNLNNITDIYNLDINTAIKPNCIPKDSLFYLAYKSLIKFEETNDHKYMVLPYEYYKYVSHMRTSPYPHMISINNKPSKVWFNDFRTEYENTIDIDITPNTSDILLSDHELFLAWDILKPGMVEREIRDVSNRIKSNPNVDYEHYMKLFEMKMNYYMNSPYVYPILGRYGLNGYMGFSYPNEYLIFDKFHNSDTIDPSKKTILTHEEAIYALPSDRFSILKGTKQTVLAERKKDPRIMKYNHTINGSFLNRLDKVIASPNISTSTLEEEIKKESKKMLIKKNI